MVPVGSLAASLAGWLSLVLQANTGARDLPGGIPSPLATLGLAALLVGVLVWTMDPPVTRRTALGFIPWILAGAAAHVLYTLDAYQLWAELMFGPVAVYFTTFIFAGMTWSMMVTASTLAAHDTREIQYLSAAGSGAAVVTLWVALSNVQGASLSSVVPTVGGLVAALVVSAVAFVALGVLYSKAVVHTGLLGWVVLFGHALDAAVTAVAIDVKGLAPHYSVARRAVSIAADLPLAETIGTGWLLVLGRVAFAMAVVSLAGWLIAGPARQRKGVVYLSLGAFAAYGLGPGVHYLILLFGT